MKKKTLKFPKGGKRELIFYVTATDITARPIGIVPHVIKC